MEIVIFIAMATAILYLMYDNRRLEKMNKISVRAAVKERAMYKIKLFGDDGRADE